MAYQEKHGWHNILYIINNNIFNIPRLALLLCIQMELIINEKYKKYNYTPLEEKVATKKFMKALRCKLAYFEILQNDVLSDLQRLEILDKFIQSTSLISTEVS